MRDKQRPEGKKSASSLPSTHCDPIHVSSIIFVEWAWQNEVFRILSALDLESFPLTRLSTQSRNVRFFAR